MLWVTNNHAMPCLLNQCRNALLHYGDYYFTENLILKSTETTEVHEPCSDIQKINLYTKVWSNKFHICEMFIFMNVLSLNNRYIRNGYLKNLIYCSSIISCTFLWMRKYATYVQTSKTLFIFSLSLHKTQTTPKQYIVQT